jgi:hypothetical protein
MTSEKNKDQARLRLVVDNDSGGYRSGRSSYRGTPDAASKDSTRSAGTRPDLRHFCSAWYRTPSFAAKDCKPPPAKIARSTTASMPSSLQLAGVMSQQPSRVIALCSMRTMAADAKTAASKAFSDELNKQLGERQAPSYGRPAWLSRELKRRVKLEASVTTCQKWLGGKQIPRSWKLRKLIEGFDLEVDALMKAGNLAPETDGDEMLTELRRLWPKITDETDREALLRMAYRAAGVPVPGPAPAPRKTAAKG